MAEKIGNMLVTFSETADYHKSAEEVFFNTLLTIRDYGFGAVKDFSDSFKRYKGDYVRHRETLQPLNGLAHILIGGLGILATPFMFIWESGKSIIKPTVDIVNPLGRFAFALVSILIKNSMLAALRIVESCAAILRGLTQIAATPLTWFLKKPLRSLITAFRGEQKIEENKGIRRLVAEIQDGKYYNHSTYYRIHEKYSKQRKQGQDSDIDYEDLHYNELMSFESHLNKIYPNNSVAQIKEAYEHRVSKSTKSDSDLRLIENYESFANAKNAYRGLFDKPACLKCVTANTNAQRQANISLRT